MQMQISRRFMKVRDLLIAAMHRGQNFRKGLIENTYRNVRCAFMQALNSIVCRVRRLVYRKAFIPVVT